MKKVKIDLEKVYQDVFDDLFSEVNSKSLKLKLYNLNIDALKNMSEEERAEWVHNTMVATLYNETLQKIKNISLE